MEWIPAPYPASGNMTEAFTLNSSTNDSGNWEKTFGGNVWGGEGSGEGGGRPSWAAEPREGGVFTVVKYLNIIGNPVLYAFLLVGKFTMGKSPPCHSIQL